jgi:hypothetical protein
LKQLQKIVRNTLEHIGIGIGNDFLTEFQLRERMDKWDCIKLKSFCTATETVTRLTRVTTECRKVFASYSFDKEVITRICRELKK